MHKLSSPAELMPPTPELCQTPEVWIGLPSTTDLQSVPESQPVEKFSWITPVAEVALPMEPACQDALFVVDNTFLSSVPVLADTSVQSKSLPRSCPGMSDDFPQIGVLEDFFDYEKDEFQGSVSIFPSNCWPVETSMFTVEPCNSSAVQITLADHV